MIYFRTCAYNAEKTIRRTIDSVLSQTIGDFTYYILENGSTDGTREIIQEYAEKDSRIKAFYNEQNRRLEENPDFWNLSHVLNADDYLAILDADDYYEPTFTEEILRFMTENDLDIAACGTIFEDEDENYISSTVKKQNYVLRTAEEYDEWFPCVHWNMRQVWGKIYSGSVTKYRYEMESPEWFPKAYGGDTINVMETIKPARGFGVLAKGLHHYQVSQKSSSYRWMEGREESDNILDDYTRDFLQAKAGGISEKNRNFLNLVYLNAVKDTCMVLLKAELSVSKRLELVTKVFGNDNFKEAIGMQCETKVDVKEILLNIREAFLKWMITNYKSFTEEDRENVYKFLASYGDVVEQLIPETVAEDILTHEPEIISAFLNGKIGTLIQSIQKYVNQKREDTSLKIEDIVFAQNVMAYFGMEEMYISYTKQYIEKLIEEKHLDEARQELTEWIQMLPGDKEFELLLEKCFGKQEELLWKNG